MVSRIIEADVEDRFYLENEENRLLNIIYEDIRILEAYGDERELILNSESRIYEC